MIYDERFAGTPCCGEICRNFDTDRSNHRDEVARTQDQIDSIVKQGVCPDCGESFVAWLRSDPKAQAQETPSGWRYNFSAACDEFERRVEAGEIVLQ